ncbi:MAG: TonB-dependent receptor, partial [candidate division KSB1 bacterium]|nr:TonB-dependent receptor [candidate division KSB1 bacterium]
PYIVQGDITVPKGQTLTIEPGVIVKFAGYYRITVRGTLVANGTSSNRIIFTSNKDVQFDDTGDAELRKISPGVDDWNVIEFIDDSDQQPSRISHCLIRYSANIIQCNNAAPILRKIIITDCKNSQLFINGSIKSITQGLETDIPISKANISKTTPPLESSSVLDELLKVEEFTFGEIKVITASKKEEKVSEAPGVISVVTKDELERFGGTTLKDILERVPSLIGSTVYMTDRSTIAPRGDQIQPSSAHVLLLINGRPVREVLEGGIKSEIYESFPVNIIEKIEVIKGPGSVLYGSNAFSAVINVITEKAGKNSVAITGLGGDAGAYGTLGEAKFQLGDLSIIAAGRYYKKADWKTTWQYALPDTDLIGTKEVSIPNKGPGAYLELNYKNLTVMSSYNQWENHYFIPDYMAYFQAFGYAYWKKGFADLGYDLQINEKWAMDFNLTYTRSTFEVSSWPDIQRDSYELVAEWTSFFNPTETFRMVFGGLYNYIKGKELIVGPSMTLPINDASRSSFGFYTQMDYRLQPSLKVIAGFQANKVEKIDLDVVPRAGLIWYPFSRVNMKALYSQAFRAPSINEIGLKHPAMQGNPNVKSEKVNTIDIGINYQGEQLQGGVNYFFSQQTDIIFQDRSGKFPIPTYNNIGEVTLQGLEFEGKCYLTKSLFLTASLLYQTNKDKEGNENVTPIANLGAKAGISYKSEKGLTVSLFNIYQGDLDEKYHTPINPSPEAYNLMNFHCRFNINKFFDWNLSHNLSLVLQVDNLLDKEIWLPDSGLIIGNTIPVNQGRAIYFGIDVSLK